MTVEVEPLTPARHAEAAAILARAFHNDPLWSWVFPAGSRRPMQLTWAIAHAVRHVSVFETSYITSGGEGVALWYPPDSLSTVCHRLTNCEHDKLCGDRKTYTWRDTLLHLPAAVVRLGLPALWRLWRVHIDILRRQREEITEPQWELDVIGVDPAYQKRGIARALLRHVLDQADRQLTPCHVITHNPANVTFYAHHGFSVIREETVFEGGPFVCSLRRDPA